MYEKDWEVLIGNCDSLLFLGGSDQTTLKYISERLGKETIRSQNNSRSYCKQGSYSLSFNKTGRELLTADEIAVMDNNNCILFIRGQYPFFTVKYNYPRHPNYHMTGDANDKNQFNPKRIITGKLLRKRNENAEKAKMVEQQARKADITDAERERRLYARNVQKTGMDGTALHEPMPTREFVEKVAETSTPCEMAKSMILSGMDSKMDRRQFESLSQYCSEEELKNTYFAYMAQKETDSSNGAQKPYSKQEAMSETAHNRENMKAVYRDAFTSDERDYDTDFDSVYNFSDNEETFYPDTYQEIAFEDDSWEESMEEFKTNADTYHTESEKQQKRERLQKAETVLSPEREQHCDAWEDEAELGALMQKAMESVTPSEGGGESQ